MWPQAAREAGSRLLFLSTDYVFDGSKGSPYQTSDARNPTSVYGESKARAEERLLEILPEVCIARTSWLFGHGGKCFPATILKLASTRPEISVVNDQRGSPTFTRDLAAALVRTLPRGRSRHRARHQFRQLHVVRVCHRNRARVRDAGRGQTRDHSRIPAPSAAARLLRSVARQPARLQHPHAGMAGCIAALSRERSRCFCFRRPVEPAPFLDHLENAQNSSRA